MNLRGIFVPQTMEKYFPPYALRLKSALQRLESKTGEKWSHKRIAEETGLDRKSVSNWLGGRNAPRGDSLVTIAEFFGVTPAWIVGEGKDNEASSSKTSSIEVQLGRRLVAALKRRKLSLPTSLNPTMFDYEQIGRAALQYSTNQFVSEVEALAVAENTRERLLSAGVILRHLAKPPVTGGALSRYIPHIPHWISESAKKGLADIFKVPIAYPSAADTPILASAFTKPPDLRKSVRSASRLPDSEKRRGKTRS